MGGVEKMGVEWVLSIQGYLFIVSFNFGHFYLGVG